MSGKRTTAVLACGGKSERMGENKLLIDLCGKSCIRRSAEAVLSSSDVVKLVIAAPEELWERYKKELSGLALEPVFCPSGKTRAESVRNAAEISEGDLILIHDGARPLVSEQEVQRSIDDASEFGSSVVCTPQKDTVRQVSDDGGSFCPPRNKLYAIRTPQTFRLDLYKKMLENSDPALTDDSQLLDALGITPHLTEGSYKNIKLTTQEDVTAARGMLGGGIRMRIGHGYDVHRLTEGRALILGGVKIAYEKGLLGHSDADVLVHAVMDALLGAAALGDIGHLFPDSDPKYTGADSLMLLEEVARVVREAGYTIENVDATVIAQAPKLAPHVVKMRENIATAAGVEASQISVKATTEEGLGFSGSGEGIAAHAVALLGKR